MSLPTKRIMLTGGAGFLGYFVTEKLKAMPVPHKRYAHQAAKALDEGISICKNIVGVGKNLFDPGLTTARS
jgi:nucleoside-diphosphate-sugar epimerase